MNPHPILMAMAILGLLVGGARAQFDHIGSVHDGVGRISDNTVSLEGRHWRHVSAGAQPGGIHSGGGGDLDHRAGFLPAVTVRHPDLDTDGDGVPDELDGDNDGDGLPDLAELDGSAFGGYAVTDHNHPDTDGDGMTDAAEAAGMYDPLDPEHRLIIVDMEIDAGAHRIYWIGKGGGTVNTVLDTTHLADAPFTNVVSSAPYFGGDAPWYKVTNTTAFAGENDVQFLRVQTE